MVEYALGLTLFLYLVMGVVDFGRAFFTYNIVSNVAREAARYATVSSHTSDQIVTYGTGRGGISGITVTVVSRGTAGNPSSPATVQASATFTPITPLISRVCCSGGPLALQSRSTMYVEY